MSKIHEDKIDDLTKRIELVNDEILDLQQIKINLMMLRREFNMEDVKETLSNHFTDEMKEMLNKRFNEEES